MFVPPNLQRRFPHLVAFLWDELRHIPESDPRVWAAFLECSMLGDGEARSALSRGDMPIVGVAASTAERTNGTFCPVMPNRIFIAQAIADRFEYDHPKAEAKALVQSTILHQLVLWGVWNVEPTGSTWVGEQGRKFDLMAYGGDVPRYWHEHSLSA